MEEITFNDVTDNALRTEYEGTPEPGLNERDDTFVKDTQAYISELADAQWRRIQRVERRINTLKEETNKDAVFHAFLIGLILGIFLTLRSNRKDDK